ncbi:hypothetical protein R1sor_022381 [Riccia sorocarpa]|uniref:ATP synthase F1 complex delta/epsilon subunit N-terminal domain-containing protein n=1 Tax=Riccia sorocarpa TaxID=122646 RepID=A0ABD3GJP1_9MARC
MLSGRQALRAGLRAWRTPTVGAIQRSFAAEATAPAVPGDDEQSNQFLKLWKSIAPNLDKPRLPSSYMKSRPPTPATIPTKLTVNLALPHKFELADKEVDMIIIPATSGQMGVLPGHVPTVVELKAGLLSVHDGDNVKKLFVSGGFAFVQQNSFADLVVIEAVELDQIDPEEVKKGLAHYSQLVNTASSELEKAEAQIGLEVHSAMNVALGA